MAEMNDDNNHIALVLGPEWLTETNSSTIKVFSALEALIDYLFRQMITVTSFRLFIPGQYLKQVLENNVHLMARVDSINSYYNSEVDFQSHTQDYRGVNPKLHFFMTSDLLARLTDFVNTHISHVSNSVDQPVSKSTVSRKKKRSKKKKVVTSNTVCFDVKCHKCLAIFQDPFQLVCGHRQCRSCIDQQEGTVIKCVQCEQETLRDEVWLDRGFKNEIQRLNGMGSLNETLMTCSIAPKINEDLRGPN